ncbi:ovochymase-1-like [Octopus bimaculoides]|uniref:ovochymase-1-like n=1 Tax=Octopus bimaculoides TaxID=37653 RepID=UPI00071D84A5|nr:ovochymase-1-like [Octopus bimaculoides]|eukprot:XP_014777086.1 PREDICTED: ovochymase-1-like [Octopus bimaculoides]
MILTIAIYWMLAIIIEKAFVSSIIGGNAVQNKEFPWLVLLSATYFTPEDNEPSIRSCGATLIDEVWLLTAAHCFSLDGNKLISADQWVASFEAKTIGTTISGLYLDIINYVKTGRKWLDKQTTVEKIILYPYFNMSDYHYFDIALVKIPDVLKQFQIAVNPYILPSSSTDKISLVGKTCNSYGWGCTKYAFDKSFKF